MPPAPRLTGNECSEKCRSGPQSRKRTIVFARNWLGEQNLAKNDEEANDVAKT